MRGRKEKGGMRSVVREDACRTRGQREKAVLSAQTCLL